MKSAAIFLCTLLSSLVAAQPQTVSSTISREQLAQLSPRLTSPPTFHLFFLGHEIGGESDSVGTVIIDPALSSNGGPPPTGPFQLRSLTAVFQFVDRGTTIDLRATYQADERDMPYRLSVNGRNYRLFASDSEVEIKAGRAHVRDGQSERDIDVRRQPFFPIDNYAPIGIQEELIKYWIAKGRPAEIASAPSGPVHITRRGQQSMTPVGRVERLSIDGVVWGTETAWFDVESRQLIALTTWAGALPFEAIRHGWEGRKDTFIAEAAQDRIADLTALTTATPTLARDTFALVGARVITGHRTDPIDHATIIVRNGRIAAVGPSASTPVPRGMPIVDVAGKTIIPGLWDMHAHASQIDWAPVYLASGVTTIRDLGGDNAFLVAMRDAIRSGRALGPRYLLAGLVDGPGPRAFGAVTAATPDEGRAVVRKYHADGFEQMKIYSLVTPEVVAAIVDEAHKLGMTVTGHVPNGMTSQSVVEAGFDSIAHMQLRGTAGSDVTKSQISFFRTHGTVMDPTQSWNELGGRPAATPLESLLPGIARLPRPLTRMFASMSAGNGDPQATHARLIDSVRLLKDAVEAGLVVVAGTDKGVPGFSLQRELELYVEGGMTPIEALQTASLMPAHAMKLDREVGTIDVGKRADLVVLDADPLVNISNVRTARMVLANGRLYDCNVLWKAAGFAPR